MRILMRAFTPSFFLISIGLLTGLTYVFDMQALAGMDSYGMQQAQNATRACSPHGTRHNITTGIASAASGQMDLAVMAYVVCDTATFVRWSSSTPTAVTTDFLLPANTLFRFYTGTGSRYFAGILTAGIGSCRIQECK